MKVFVKGIIHFLITKLFAWRVRPGKLLSLHLEMENSRWPKRERLLKLNCHDILMALSLIQIPYTHFSPFEYHFLILLIRFLLLDENIKFYPQLLI